MRLAVVLAVLLSACGASALKQHALVALASSTLIDEVGAAIEQESYEDWQRVGGTHADVDELYALKAHWEPVREDYRRVVTAHKDYLRAISEANERGDATLVKQPARTLLKLWTRLDEIADQLGLDAPPTPDALRKLAGDEP